MHSPRGTALLLVLLLAYFAVDCGRGFFLNREEPPAFFVAPPPGLAVLLGEGFPRPGIHQFPDGFTPLDVIKMTKLIPATAQAENPALRCPLQAGEALDIALVGTQVIEINRYWMPAPQRLTLGIPLHPDRMSREDWEALPGIGPKLAQVLDDDRQRNGVFGSLEGLERVKGVGPKRIEKWKKFFKSAGSALHVSEIKAQFP